MSRNPAEIAVGATVSTGTEPATVRAFDTDGPFVTTREGIESLPVEHEHAGHTPDEADLMWPGGADLMRRCSDCGEMAELDDIPDACPNCDAPKAHRYCRTGG